MSTVIYLLNVEAIWSGKQESATELGKAQCRLELSEFFTIQFVYWAEIMLFVLEVRHL